LARAVFLDSDGVINEIVYFSDLGLLDSPLNPNQFRLLPNVPEAIRSFNRIGLKVIVVSNQPAVAKGKMTKTLFEQIRIRMKEELESCDAKIDGEYYCLHHPEAKIAKYRIKCGCRKPKPGLILKAVQDFNLEVSKCYVVGDSLVDIQAGKSVGCKTFLIGKLKCDLCKLINENKYKPDYIVSSLFHASKMIKKEVNKEWNFSLTQQILMR
jgi:histidinol-phosphate phosphatase family protein